MAVNSNLWVNNTLMEKVYVNHQDVYKVYVNGILVFEVNQAVIVNYLQYTFDPADGFFRDVDGREYAKDFGDLPSPVNANLYSGTFMDLTVDTNAYLEIPLEPDPNGPPYILTRKTYQEGLWSTRPVPNDNWSLRPGFSIRMTVEGVERAPDGRYYLIGLGDSVNPRWYLIGEFNGNPNQLVLAVGYSSTAENFYFEDSFYNNTEFLLEWRTSTNTLWINGVDTGSTPQETVTDTMNYWWVGSNMGNSGYYTSHNSGIKIFNFEVNGETFDLEAYYGQNHIIGSNGSRLDLHSNDSYVNMWHRDPASANYVVYFDFNTRKHVQIKPAQPSIRFQNQIINSIAVLKVGIQLTQADLDLLDADPNLLPRLALGETTTGLTIQPFDLKEYYPLSDIATFTGQRCFDLLNPSNYVDVQNYNDDMKKFRQPYGWQNLRFELDPATGLPAQFLTIPGINNNINENSPFDPASVLDTGIHFTPGSDYVYFIAFENIQFSSSGVAYALSFGGNPISVGCSSDYYWVSYDSSHFKLIFRTELPLSTYPIIGIGVFYDHVNDVVKFYLNDNAPITESFSTEAIDLGSSALLLGAFLDTNSSTAKPRDPFKGRIKELMYSTNTNQDIDTAFVNFWNRVKE